MANIDAQVIANAKRQAELEARGRDLTKPVPPPGHTGDSMRALPGFGAITDEMLAERANFNLRDHLKQQKAPAVRPTLDLSKMTPEELEGLMGAAAQELATKREEKP